MADGDMGFARDHRGAGACLGRRDRGVDRVRVVTIARENIPAAGRETRQLIGAIGDRDLAIDGDAIVIPQHDQPRQFLTARKRDRLLADTFHQAAIARDAIGVVVDDLLAPFGAQKLLGHGETHGIGDALAQGAGCRFDPHRMAIFGMACRDCAQPAEILDLLQRHIGRAGQIEQRVKQHRAMARRQDKAVAVGPIRGRCIKAQMLVKQHGRHIGHAHRHAGMARIGRGHGVQRQCADTSGPPPMIGMACGACSEVHCGVLRMAACISHARPRRADAPAATTNGQMRPVLPEAHVGATSKQGQNVHFPRITFRLARKSLQIRGNCISL